MGKVSDSRQKGGKCRKSSAKAYKYKRYQLERRRIVNKLAYILRNNGPEAAVNYAKIWSGLGISTTALLRRVRSQVPGLWQRALVKFPALAEKNH